MDTPPSVSVTVSVIVVNLNGRLLLRTCLDALVAQDYPRERIEIILVDNGSTDDSVAFVREMYPHVRVVEAGRNLGFAGGNNLGARIATGETLALINNDARADPYWLRAMVEALTGRPDVACVASKILDQDGKTIDFVGPAMNLYGRAFQVDEGMPLAPGFYDAPHELLAPCGGAMLIRRDVFGQVGGFDEDYIAYYEDLDLGWRLWLHGFKVILAPQAVVYHRQHQTGSGFPVEQRYFLSEVNALRTVIKNYEEENLWRVLPLSLFMGVKRSLDQARLDRKRYSLGHPVPGDAQDGVVESEPQMTRVATSFLVAIDQVADEMPRLMQKRRRIQAARVRSDAEIFARFPMRPDNWLFPWRRYHVVQDQLAKELGVADVLQPRHGSRLLIITHEAVGPRMAGPGIRAWELGCALSERFDVTLAAPGEPARSHPGLRVVGYEKGDPYYASLAPYINSADVVLATGYLFANLPRLRDLDKPAIVDLYDPFELEKLAQSPTVEEQFHVGIDVESMAHLRLEGAIGDFFVCASERQRDFWLGTLLVAGRVNAVTYAQDPALRKLIDVVPFGVPSEPPRKQRAVLKGVRPGIGPEDKVLLWNGGLWQWFDPLTLIDALVKVLRVRDDVKLFFAAGRHFDPETVPEMPIHAQTMERCRELDLLDRHVFFGDWIPYDERGEYLLEADLGVSIHRPGVESAFASRTRLLDCIWAGLPVVSTVGDPVSDMIATCGLGQTVPPKRPDLMAEVILSMLEDDGLRDRVAENARPVRSGLAWSRVVEPIAEFLERVAFAPDALTASRAAAEARRTVIEIECLRARLRELEQERDRLRAHLNDIRQGRVMRLLRAVDSLLGRE
jgi:GT2 family glycosyltransferase/glycosyltransferase involved in cell wall biosynthesis